MNFLLDTCVISELIAPEPDTSVVAWLNQAREEQLYFSVLTMGEIKKGVEKLPASRRRAALQVWLDGDLIPRFGSRLIALDQGVMLTWGALVAGLEARGRRLPAIDSLIAASALHHELALVTRNVTDFADTGVRLVNPWDET